MGRLGAVLAGLAAALALGAAGYAFAGGSAEPVVPFAECSSVARWLAVDGRASRVDDRLGTVGPETEEDRERAVRRYRKAARTYGTLRKVVRGEIERLEGRVDVDPLLLKLWRLESQSLVLRKRSAELMAGLFEDPRLWVAADYRETMLAYTADADRTTNLVRVNANLVLKKLGAERRGAGDVALPAEGPC
jgi:hypothetical protein